MKVSEVLDHDDYKILEGHRNFSGAPDPSYLDDILISHSLTLDISEYALLRIAEHLSVIRSYLENRED